MTTHLQALTTTATDVYADVLAAVPDPGMGTEPPGAGGFLTILGWAAWIVFGLCVLGVLVVAGKMAVAFHRGEGGQAAGQLGVVLAAAVLASSASAVVGLVLT